MGIKIKLTLCRNIAKTILRIEETIFVAFCDIFGYSVFKVYLFKGVADVQCESLTLKIPKTLGTYDLGIEILQSSYWWQLN